MAEAAKPGKTNGYDKHVLRSYIERVENLEGEVASIMGKAMADCKPVHEDIAETLQEAKDQHGIPKKALKAVLKMRKLERDKEKALEALGDEDRDSFEQMADALGDFVNTPLGQAAMSAAQN